MKKLLALTLVAFLGIANAGWPGWTQGGGGGGGANSGGATDITGLLLGNGATIGAYAGSSCTNQFFRSVDASGVATCASVAMADHATQATNTVIGNATSGTATPTALAVGSCSATGSALKWTTNTGFGCSTTFLTSAANSVALANIATEAADTMVGNWTSGVAGPTANAMPSCADTTGNHLNYVAGTGITCGTSAGSVALSGLSAASGAKTLANGDNAQIWQWALTTASKSAFTFTESAAGTNGTTAQYLVDIKTLASSTTNPFRVNALGNTNDSILVDKNGKISIKTPTLATGTVTQSINIVTGADGASGGVGAINITGGQGNADVAGPINIITGAAGGAGFGSGALDIETGAVLSGATGPSGAVTLSTGNSQFNNSSSGVMTIKTGLAAGSGSSGAMTIKSDTPGATGSSGAITIATGNGGATSGNSGILTLKTGTKTSGTIGTILLQPNSATALQVDTTGIVITGTLTASAVVSSGAAQTGYLCYNTSGGVITYDGGATCLVSREELKDNFGPITDGLSDVMALRPFWGRYKEGTPMGDHRTQPFLGARYTAKVDYRLASFDKEGEPLGVRYENMTAVLVAAVQEQQATIIKLTKRIAKLEKSQLHIRQGAVTANDPGFFVPAFSHR